MSSSDGAETPRGTKQSTIVLLVGLFLILLNGAIGILPMGPAGETISYALFGVLMLAAIVILGTTAAKFEKGSPVRRQWGLLAIGVALGIIGDITYLVQGMVTGEAPPFPSWAVPVYVLQYGFLLAGMLSAALAYKALVDLRKSAAVAFGGSLLLTALLLVMESSGIFYEMAAKVKPEAMTFTVLDTMLIFAPALFVILVITQVGGANFARPWKAVALGGIIFAFGDIANFSVGAFAGEVNTGVAIVGMTRMASALMFAVAILMAREAFALRD